MKKYFSMTLLILLSLYLLICLLAFTFQEKLIFFPVKLEKTYQFNFIDKFEERTFTMPDNIKLSGVLFPSEKSKGVIFYLHGNAGSLVSWGEIASTYTKLNYDVLMLDYRGYGKSEGRIRSQKALYNDLQVVYDEIKKEYNEEKIIILGYSIGTGPAAKLASQNHPKMLILQAPYYSLPDVMLHSFPMLPTFILKYKFETYKYLKNCKMPVVIFHGTGDDVIYYTSSLKLKKDFKAQDTLITLEGHGHTGMSMNREYREALKKILGKE